jgi:osmotically inducible protein OsmC
MPVRKAEAVWEGTLQEGKGAMTTGGGVVFPFSNSSRFEEGAGSNPEELLGAAHAGCFTMALGARLGRNGFPATRLHTVAKVHLIKGETGSSITLIELETEGVVPGLDEQTFREHAEAAKVGCIVSRALAATEIHLIARLVKE